MSSVINMFISPLSLDSQRFKQSTQCVYVSNSSWLRAGCLLLVYILHLIRRYVTTFHKILDYIVRCHVAPGRAGGVWQGTAGACNSQNTDSVPLTPESKTHKGTPRHAGIGIIIPSPHIPLSQVDPEFFISKFFSEFFFTQNHLKFSYGGM